MQWQWGCEVVERNKGIRFIRTEDGGADAFVHISAVEKAGYTNLAEGAARPSSVLCHKMHLRLKCRAFSTF